MGRPPTKEFERPALKKLARKKTAEELDEDIEEIVTSSDQEEEDPEAANDNFEDVELQKEEHVEEEEEVEEKPRRTPKNRLPPPSRKKPRREEVEEPEEEADEEEDDRRSAKNRRKPAPTRKKREEVADEDDESSEESEEFEEGDGEEQAPKSSGPSWLTIGILVVIIGFFAAFISLPILFFQNNPVLGLAALVAIGVAIFMYFRTEADKRDSFFLSGPGLVTLGALLCLWLGGLSEFNKEKQRLADEAEAAAMQAQKDKETADAAAKAKIEAEAVQVVPPSRPGTEPITVGKWTVTQDERGSYRVNGKKITGTWKLRDDQDHLQFLSEEELTEIRDALNKFDDKNKKQ